MIERGDEPDRGLDQHAVAEHVARHVPDPGGREGRRADVHVHLAEMPAHRFPGPACRDAHFLVVVTGRAAGREGVAEPESAFHRNPVRDVGERRRALVGRDHQIRIVAVVAHDARGRRHALPPEIVGDVEQTRNETDIGCGAFLLDGFA